MLNSSHLSNDASPLSKPIQAASPKNLAEHSLAIAEGALIGVGAMDALMPAGRMPCPQDTPVELVETARRARHGDAVAAASLAGFAEWRQRALTLEQDEARKVETLCWIWRTLDAATVGRVCDVAHDDTREGRTGCNLCTRKRMIAAVVGALVKRWGVDVASATPLDFAAARKIASRITRRTSDLSEAWRGL